MTLAFLIDAYDEEQFEDGTSRTVMHLHPALAPFKAAILPLSKKLSEEAKEVYGDFIKHFLVIMMNPVRLENGTAAMMKLVHLSVLHLILILKKITW